MEADCTPVHMLVYAYLEFAVLLHAAQGSDCWDQALLRQEAPLAQAGKSFFVWNVVVFSVACPLRESKYGLGTMYWSDLRVFGTLKTLACKPILGQVLNCQTPN